MIPGVARMLIDTVPKRTRVSVWLKSGAQFEGELSPLSGLSTLILVLPSTTGDPPCRQCIDMNEIAAYAVRVWP